MSSATEVPDAVRWPAGHEPEGAAVHAVNRALSTASTEAIWAWLVRPDRWGRYYGNARRVRHLEGPWPELAVGTRFSWVTFGAPVTTEVTELVAFERLAWTGSGLGSRGHHAWVLVPEGGRVRIHTEETQRGLASRILRPALRPAMLHMHQRWVDGLAAIAQSGARP